MRCLAALRPARAVAGACPLCLEPGCARCPDNSTPWDWLVAAFDYRDQLRDLLLLYKFGPRGGRPALARPLGELLATAIGSRRQDADIDVVTHVPSHRARTRERGFDAALLLAERVAVRLDRGPVATLLRRRGAAAPRSRAGVSSRDGNPFHLRRRAARRLEGRVVLLVDDVLTTGATA
jgi:predicted amidophosphoribosyltransferase